VASTSSSDDRTNDPLRPADYDDGSTPAPESADGGAGGGVNQPKLGFVGWLRFGWRQLTSMRTALLLLLLLAIAAVPGSLVPQRSSDPNGVTQYFQDNPGLAPVLDSFQMFDVYTSAWFSAVYLLLFVSLIGCIIPRTKHHLEALRARPPKTPVRLSRLSAYTERDLPGGPEAAEAALADAAKRLKQSGYRVERYELRGEASVSAERGYLRETGNLVFHTALLGVLVAVGFGGGFGFAGQRVVVEGQSFVNTLGAFDSFNPGRFFNDDDLTPYRLTLDELDAVYETQNSDAIGQPIDFTAHIEIEGEGGESTDGTVKVNEPLRAFGTDVFLLGNGYAPTVTVRNADGDVVFTDSVPFLPEDANLTSIGVIKVTDGLDEQLGMIGFLYPTQDVLTTGAYTSTYPDLVYPVLTLNVYEGDLGIDDGTPTSVYTLDPTDMEQLTGGDTGVDSLELMPGQTADLPGGRGTVTFENASPDAAAGDYSQSVKRFASFDIHHDPTQAWVLVFAILILAGLLTSLFVPRRRVWVKAAKRPDGRVVLEYAGLARGEDPTLDDAVRTFAETHSSAVGATAPGEAAAAEASAQPSRDDSSKPAT
jgi:cytochrome c biogenesis protein